MTLLLVRERSRDAAECALAWALAALILAGCLPAPGVAGDPPGAPATAVPAPAPDGAAGDVASTCADPGDGPLPARSVPVVRPSGAPADPAAPNVVPLDAAELVELALGSDDGSTCVPRLILASTSDPALRALAASRAVIEQVPLLLGKALPGTLQEARALRAVLIARGIEEVVVYGPVPAWTEALGARVSQPAAPGTDPLGPALDLAAGPVLVPVLVLVLEEDLAAQADVVAGSADGLIPIVVPHAASSASTSAGASAPDPGRTSLLGDVLALGSATTVAWAASTPEFARMLTALLPEAGPARWDPPARAGATAELWLGDVRDADSGLLAAVVAAARGAAFIAVDGADLRREVGRTERMRAGHAHPDGPVDVVLVGRFEAHTGWQLDTVLTGTPLPGGGFLPLEDRRIVALYGSPDTPSLGLLGEQDDVAGITRARELAARYADAADGRTVVPGLDIIATIASAAPEPTGDYSRRVPIERLRPLVALAGEAGVAVFLDLQPGRTSFLTQAREYEDLLREPHVHLALDPEWRLGPRERHLVVVGSVDADEVQAVADWLADLVRTRRLPQKVLMLHQFKPDMLPGREDIVLPAEVVGVVHIDGFGTLRAKDRTYAALTSGAEGHWSWGWKNFTRLDVPVATPEQSLARVPVPVVVTYQ